MMTQDGLKAEHGSGLGTFNNVTACGRGQEDGDRFAAEMPEPTEPLVKVLTRRPVTAGAYLGNLRLNMSPVKTRARNT